VKTEGVTPGSLVEGGAPAVAPVVHSAPVRTVTRTVVKTVDRPVRVEPQDPGIMVIRGTDTTFVKR
jgi:hypothetical protein